MLAHCCQRHTHAPAIPEAFQLVVFFENIYTRLYIFSHIRKIFGFSFWLISLSLSLSFLFSHSRSSFAPVRVFKLWNLMISNVFHVPICIGYLIIIVSLLLLLTTVIAEFSMWAFWGCNLSSFPRTSRNYDSFFCRLLLLLWKWIESSSVAWRYWNENSASKFVFVLGFEMNKYGRNVWV